MKAASFDQRDHADGLLTQWVAKSLCPISILQDPVFTRYLDYVSRTPCEFSAPSTQRVEALIENKASRLRNTVKEKIFQECDFYSASSEIWTSMSADSCMTITLHYVNKHFVTRSWTLDVVNLPKRYHDKMLERALTEVFIDWHLPLEKCTRFLQKNGRNIPKACENLGLKYLPCVAHSLHLIVGAVLLQKKEEILEEDWMFEGNKPNAEKFHRIRFADVKASDEEIDSLWTKIDTLVDSTSVNCEELETVRCVVHRFRKLAVFFVRSQKGALRLKTLCYSTRSNIRDMPMDCPTKWRSTIMMLSHLIQLRPALDAFFEYLHSDAGMNEFSELTRTKLYSPTEEDWVTIQCLEELLLQFDALTKEMRRSKYSSLALALPAIRALRTMLLDREMFDQVLSFVQVEELKSRVVRCCP